MGMLPELAAALMGPLFLSSEYVIHAAGLRPGSLQDHCRFRKIAQTCLPAQFYRIAGFGMMLGR
jgi:hypothetical protein